MATLRSLSKNPDLFFLIMSKGPLTGNAATGVPQAIDSIIVLPKVSFRLGNTQQSAIE